VNTVRTRLTYLSQLNNVIIAQITPYAFSSLGYKYFIVYAVTSCTNGVLCYLLFPETKNKTLEEIGEQRR
jgi:hypothetical protein